MADAVIIAGTGIAEQLAVMQGESELILTSHGEVAVHFIKMNGHQVAVMSRHGAGHSLPPHRVPYKSLSLACAQLAPKLVIGTAAVGCVHADWRVGTMVVCTDCIDASVRNLTLFEDEVKHTDMTDIFGKAPNHLARALNELQMPFKSGVYLQVNGPRYETPSEIKTYKNWGADVVGMTAASEAVLMREANVAYECLAIVTNPAAGVTASRPSHQEVTEAMQDFGSKALQVISLAIELALSHP